MICRLTGAGWGEDVVGAPSWTLRSLDDLDPHDPLADLRALEPATYVGFLSYDLRTILEPSAHALPSDGHRAINDRDTPALAVARIDPTEGPALGAYRVSPFVPDGARAAYEHAVARCVELIHAGDCFQANLAHRLTVRFEGDAHALAHALIERTRPAFGAMLELPGHAIVSVSPELFLDYDPHTRRVVTRPIKGTRPLEAPLSELERAEKDTAELAMITDLMRNDLGRVATPGSVRVESARDLDAHAGELGVRHASSTVSCELREDGTIVNLLGAAFPPGSVTGAPKVRAMQVIDALEPVRRHVYCGCLFLIRPDGSFTSSVAIRTLTIDRVRRTLDLPVGAGIVADSDPASEWHETLTKARAIVRAIETGATSSLPADVAHA